MELTTSHAIQGLLLLMTIGGGYAVTKSNLARVMEDLEIFHKNFEKFKTDFDSRLDDASQSRAVFASQIEVLKDINSVSALEHRNRETATMQAKINVMESQISHLLALHNGKHPN
tara:strand:- start:6993 stop:7337 length:345 start_codon:yes stop_codon:yes gene_type:complete